MLNATTFVRALRASSLSYLRAIHTTACLILALLFLIPLAATGQPVTNGRFHGDGDAAKYNVYGVADANMGILFSYAAQDSIHALMRVDPTANDNVFGDSKNGSGADTAYVDSVGWIGGRTWKELYNSDYNEWHVECGAASYTWKQDYLGDGDNDKLPRQAAGGEADFSSDNTTDAGDGTQPPGLNSASSLMWNMNHSTWDVTMGGTRTSWDTYKSPTHFLTNGYPYYDLATNWEWPMEYEIAFPRSVCGEEDISIWIVSAHNSPVKDGQPDIPVCDPQITACDVLPVELTDFVALEDHGDILLRWATASETNNAGFSVEHTVNAGIFREIGFVPGVGNSNDRADYSFRVNDIKPGRHSFKLKQVDFDGSFHFSPIVEIDVETPGRFILENAYPNPFNPQATIRFSIRERVPVTMTLYDVTGRAVQLLYSGTPAPNEMHSVEIDGEALPSGVYIVRLVGDTFVANQTVTLAK
jgi:hypothetical protein